MTVRVGVNLPYSDRPLPDATWRQIEALNPQQFVITSFAHEDTLARLCRAYPDAWFHVRPRTGPQHQPWPRGILDYRSWDTERSLRECLTFLTERVPHVFWVGGNEPELEWARSWDPGSAEAIDGYADWWLAEAPTLKAAFPSVKIAVAPIGQGWPERSWRWFRGLSERGCYDLADFLADHCYFAAAPVADESWGGRALALRREPALARLGPIHNLETNDNGELFAMDAHERAAAYAEYVSWCRSRPDVFACVSLFTLEGAPEDEHKPRWWFLTDEIAAAVAPLVTWEASPGAPATAPAGPTPAPSEVLQPVDAGADGGASPDEAAAPATAPHVGDSSLPEVPAMSPIAIPNPSKDEVIAACLRGAERTGVPAEALIALAWAESAFVHWERWHIWTDEALAAIARDDRAALQAILDRGRPGAVYPSGTRDYSFGAFHQSTWGLPVGADPWNLETVLAFRDALFDLDHAADVAAAQLRRHLERAMAV